ncbi:MAG: DNA-binding transcriptional regulator Fis [Xanthomonadales bacterium]|nr:DNA-binding transcriptional regulator Fis [Xanthomonadales bacterium]
MHARRGRIEALNGQSALRKCVSQSVKRFLVDMDDDPGCDLYDMVLREVEAPMFAEVMRHCEGNQTRAAEALGINRATLRKKLRRYGLA